MAGGPSAGTTWDWLIVGAGSAGCVLAARLSEDPACRVLLVEAGPDWRPADAPMELRALNPGLVLGQQKFDEYQYPTLRARRTEAQPPRLFWRGRGLGGSSTVNGVIAIRALPEDHDRWATEFGCDGWGYEAMLPYLCRLEDDADFGDRPYHGRDGPVPVWRMPREQWGPVDRAVAEAALEEGYGWCEDHNAPTGTGVSPYAINARHGERVTTNDAYLEPARGRENLRILADTPVDRVMFAAGRATGVRARVEGEWATLAADRVVLCAGAVHSPAILLRSGIGPAGALVDLPVGEGLQDHPMAILWAHIKPEAQVEPTARHTNCCVRYSSGLAGAGENDMLVVAMNQSPRGPAFGLVGVWVNQCVSRGHLVLASPDPLAHPVIEERMLSARSDLVRLRDGTRRALELLAAPAFAEVVEAVSIDMRGTGPEALEDDAAVDAWLMANAADIQHICGTCRMGAPDAATSVVGPDCGVLGVEALWVVDASVFPEVPRANTHLTVLAVAERMAEALARMATTGPQPPQ